jgi:hypothetical protein
MYKGHYNTETGEYKGFYIEGIHQEIPAPTIDLSKEEWEKAITGDYRVVKGKNTFYEKPGPTVEESFFIMRRQRDSLLSQSDWTQFIDSPLSEEQKQAWATYRQQLRDFIIEENIGKPFPHTP